MIFISIIIALVVDRIFSQLQTFRRFKWLQDYADWMTDVLSISRLPAWVSLIVLMLPLLLLVSFLQGIFANGLFGLFALAFNVVVLFYCLGPLDTDQQVDEYLHSIDIGDEQKRFEAASALREKPAEMSLSDQAAQVVDAIFTGSHRRIFACIFWFVVLGALGAVFYRLIERSTKLSIRDDEKQALTRKFTELLGYLEWIPARLTIAAFMVSGHFEGAFSGYKKAANDLVEVNEINHGILISGGRGAIQFNGIETDQQASNDVKKARGLVLRSLVVWLVFSLILTWL